MSDLHAIQGSDGVTLEFMTEPDDPVVDQPPSSIAAAMVFGALAFLALSNAPILLAALVDAGRLTSSALGKVATLEILGLAAGASLGPAFLRRGRLRLKVVVACIGLVALNLACRHATSFGQFGLLRLMSGLLEGGVLAAATLILAYTRNPERMNGYFLGVTALPQVASTYILSSFAIPRFGPDVGFSVMAVAAVIAAVASLGVKGALTQVRQAQSRPQPRTWRGVEILALFTILLQNAAIGAGYSYLVQVAVQDAVPSDMIGLSMASLQAAAVLGAFAVGVFGWRLGHIQMLTIGCLAQAAVAMALVGHIPPIVYLFACGLFGLLWNGLLPYGLKLLIQLDPSRRLGLLNAPISLAGLGLGPFIASLVVDSTHVAPALMLSATMFAASAGLYLLVHARTPRPGLV